MCSKANCWFLHLVSEVMIKGTYRQLLRAGRAWKAEETPHSTAPSGLALRNSSLSEGKAAAQGAFSKGKVVPAAHPPQKKSHKNKIPD